MKDLKWFEFKQNNSGGRFIVNDKVCNKLLIEAVSFNEAVRKAEELGCYWDGVSKGIDCSCCGDRWSKYDNKPVNIEKYKTEGYGVSIYGSILSDHKTEWNRKYGKYETIKNPTFRKGYSTNAVVYSGSIKFNNIEEYAQFMADEYGWTVPDIRIYYHNGSVKEIFRESKEE